MQDINAYKMRSFCQTISILQETCMTSFTLPTLSFKTPDMKIVEFANSVDPDEVAHSEPPHLDLYCLLCNLWILNMMHCKKIISKLFLKILQT